MPRDYYDVLGVQRNASPEDIKRAFRKKAHELHPDKGGDAQAFKEVNEAYQVLGDQKRRATYDQFGHAAFQGGSQGFGGFGFGQQGFEGVHINFDDLGDLGDVLGSMFGFGGRNAGSSRQKKGRNVETTVEIDFMDAFKGVQRDISPRLQTVCSACDGKGAAHDAKIITCKTCNGTGKNVQIQRTMFGTFQTARTCTACHGAGSAPDRPCTTCSGTGVVVKNVTIPVFIPAGIDDGETVKIAGAGEAVPQSGLNGDLYVHVRVKKHPAFLREGNNVSSEAYVPMTAFVLGGNVDIETVEGIVELKVPSGTQSGTTFRLRGKGFPYLHGRGRGDHIVKLYPDIPTKCTKEQKKMLDGLKGTGL